MTDQFTDLAVIGAGACGLTAAWYAQSAGLRVQCFEAGDRAGGRIATTREPFAGGQVVVEHGPAGWLGEHELLTELCSDLELHPIESGAADSHRYLVHQGRLVPFPQSAGAMATTPLLAGREKMRVATERWADFAPEGMEESAKEFFTRRFGAGFAEKIVAPVVRGLFAGNYETLSIHAAFPKLVDVEYKYGSITKALKKNPKFFGQKLRSFAWGLSELTDAMAKGLGGSFVPSKRIDTVMQEQGWWFLYSDGEQVGVARQIAVCLPVEQTAVVLREYLPAGTGTLHRHMGQDLASVAVMYKRDDVQDACAGFGILAPVDHPSPVLNVQFAHSIFPQHVPDDFVLLRCLMGGEASPNILNNTDDDLLRTLHEDLDQWLGIDGMLQKQWITRVPGGVPHYGKGHNDALRELGEALDPNPGLHLGGDAFFGIGITPAIDRGRQIAADAIDFRRA